jgi:hypothetical protein
MKSTWFSSPLCNTERVVAQRHGSRRTLPFRPRILTVLVLVLVLLWSVPVSAAILEGQVLGCAGGADLTIEPTLGFTRDDIVRSEVSLRDTREGDFLQWTFTGPQGMTYNESRTLTPGQSTARAKLDLSLLTTNEAVGSWTLDLSLNGVPADRQNFTVEPLTGLVWWAPFVGAGLLVLSVVILGVLVFAGVVIIQRVFRRKKK